MFKITSYAKVALLMPCIVREICPNTGPVLNVFLSAHARIHRPIEIYALIDTGASHSGVTVEAAELARLTEYAGVGAKTPGGISARRVFSGCIHVAEENKSRPIKGQHLLRSDNLPLVEIDNHGEEWHMLIGRDVLQSCVFSYTGFANQFTFCF